MSDALVSPAVAAATIVAAVVVVAETIKQTSKELSPYQGGERRRTIALMGVLGAFVFAAQMINFSILGTGSSGHIVGGVLLAALLGGWGAFLTLTAVLVLQALLFGDGGLLALGCNILNMALMSTLIAYPLIFKPLMRRGGGSLRLMLASLLASVVALELGAFAVTVESELSGITALDMGQFLLFMLPIHLLIGIGEGLATGAILCFVRRRAPQLLDFPIDDVVGSTPVASASSLSASESAPCTDAPTLSASKSAPLVPSASSSLSAKVGRERTYGIGYASIAIVALVALFVGASFSFVASERPDGLEWSLERVSKISAIEPPSSPLHDAAASLQESISVLPDYNSIYAGIIGIAIIVAFATLLAILFGRSR